MRRDVGLTVLIGRSLGVRRIDQFIPRSFPPCLTKSHLHTATVVGDEFDPGCLKRVPNHNFDTARCCVRVITASYSA
jgi:hypothetical protein